MQKIVIVGVGALGSHLVQFLRNLDLQKVKGSTDVYKLVMVDFDRVEQKNTLAQFHTKSGVGKNKAQGLQQTLNFLFGIRVDAVPHKLTKDNVRTLLDGAALVLDCLDNGASRRVVQAFVRELSIPCLHGALAANGSIGRVVWDDRFQIDEEGEGERATCEDGEHLPFIGLVSAYLARSAQEFLTSGRQMSFQVFSKSPAISL
jgi:molybdopterin/thiamine biosynthesis adenylyltransferase